MRGSAALPAFAAPSWSCPARHLFGGMVLKRGVLVRIVRFAQSGIGVVGRFATASRTDEVNLLAKRVTA